MCLQGSESGCADCKHHVETIERQASDISQLTQTIDAHEQAFNLIQLNIGQLLHPDSDDDVITATQPRSICLHCIYQSLICLKTFRTSIINKLEEKF